MLVWDFTTALRPRLQIGEDTALSGEISSGQESVPRAWFKSGDELERTVSLDRVWRGNFQAHLTVE